MPYYLLGTRDMRKDAYFLFRLGEKKMSDVAKTHLNLLEIGVSNDYNSVYAKYPWNRLTLYFEFGISLVNQKQTRGSTYNH